MDILSLNLLLIIIEAILIKLFVPTKKLARKIYCSVVFLQMFILHAFVDPESLPDLPLYIKAFQLFAENDLSESIIIGYVGIKMEYGWIVLCKISSLVSNDYHILILFSSLIIVAGYIISIYKFSSIIWLSVFIFACTTFNQSLFVLRQHVAIAICLLSIPSLLERNLIRFLSIIFIAFSIHWTAIIFIVVYYLYHNKLNKNFWIKFIIITISIRVLSSFLFSWLFSYSWYKSYADSEGANFTNFIISCCPLLLFLLSIGFNLRVIGKTEKCFLIMSILSVFITFVGVGFSPTNRLAQYFTVSSIYLIPISITHFRRSEVRVLITMSIVAFYTLLFFSKSNTTYVQDLRFSIF